MHKGKLKYKTLDLLGGGGGGGGRGGRVAWGVGDG